MYIEPCCVHRKLPPLLMLPQASFHNAGDWLLSDLIKAMASVMPGAELTLIVCDVPDVFFLRQLRAMVASKAISALRLISTTDIRESMLSEIPELDRINYQYVYDSHNATSLVALRSDTSSLVVIGPHNFIKDFKVRAYISLNEPTIHAVALQPYDIKFRLYCTPKTTTP